MTFAVSPRIAALRDVEETVDYYTREVGSQTADRFVDGLAAAYDRLAHAPKAGSPLLGASLGLPELRTWPIPGFPYLVCYQARPGVIDVWRVLHAQRDLRQAFSPSAH
ncbi:type II toxin-antitoxin system RelE/ParE family toxin [Brevundimonas sp. SL130]|uniref:type II toxin-antitoxin system RelE/ParE family toxin n=1 Tax=Brevundimonas sp. SL130 TaxID=2995143 RepID=UPI003B636D1F